MGRGVAVAAHDEQAGQREALLGPDHVHDSLPRVLEPEQRDPVLGGVVLEHAHHARDVGIVDVVPGTARRHVVIGDAEGQARLGDARAARLELAEGVERPLVHVMAVDPQQRLAVLAPRDLMGCPQLVEQGRRRVHAHRED